MKPGVKPTDIQMLTAKGEIQAGANVVSWLFAPVPLAAINFRYGLSLCENVGRIKFCRIIFCLVGSLAWFMGFLASLMDK